MHKVQDAKCPISNLIAISNLVYGLSVCTDDNHSDVLTNGIYVAMFSYFGYLCGYFSLRGLDTQQTNLATKISNLRNKSHLDTKMNTSVPNCPNL